MTTARSMTKSAEAWNFDPLPPPRPPERGEGLGEGARGVQGRGLEHICTYIYIYICVHICIY